MGLSYTVWVTGAKGYIGQEIVRRLTARGCLVHGTDKEVDITDLDKINQYVDRNRPDVIVNCAGIRREDTSESNKTEVFRVNALGARNLAIASAAIGIPIVQVSSDDVFPSDSTHPVDEFDTPRPNTIYGKSKLAGEKFVRDMNQRHIIIRSSWVYDISGGRLRAILQAAHDGTTIEQRTDQFASPTSVKSYVDFVIAAIASGEFGLFHVTTAGSCSRYDFAARALELCGYDPSTILVPVADPTTSENVVLDDMMIKMTNVIEMPTWQDDLASYLDEVRTTTAKKVN